MCARRSLYEDARATSRSVYPVAGDHAVTTGECNPSALTDVIDDTSIARPHPGVRSNENRASWWPCSRHCPANIVSFDRPVATAESGNPRPPNFEDPAVGDSPVVT